jgi:transposase-like protein
MDSVQQMRCAAQERIWQAGAEVSVRYLTAFLDRFMRYERDAFVGCTWHERSPWRQGHRNGYQERALASRYGPLRLRVPRTRGTERPFRTVVFDRYRRRAAQLDAAVEQWVAAGCATRAVEDLFEGAFGGLLSKGTVSRILGEVDAELARWRRRPLERSYRVLWLDAKHGRERGGRRKGRRRKAVLLVAWGLRHDGGEELVDFRACAGEEDEANWTAFLTSLERRGVKAENRWAERLEMIVTDGHDGLEVARGTVYPDVPHQRCIFHKVQNLADHLADRQNRQAIQRSASAIYEVTQTAAEARRKAERWARLWRRWEPEAVGCFLADFEATLRYLTLPSELHRRVRTNNPVERVLLEIEKATGHAGAWMSLASWERHVWVTWKKLRRQGYAPLRRRRIHRPAGKPQFTRNS